MPDILNKTDTICGLNVNSRLIDRINEEDEIIVNDTAYDIFVGPCNNKDVNSCHTDLPPHYHLISKNAHVIIAIGHTDYLNIIDEGACVDLPILNNYLQTWFKEEHYAMKMFSSRQFITVIWNASNPENEYFENEIEKKKRPLPRTKPKKIYTATITTTTPEINKELWYIHILKADEINAFTEEHQVGGWYEGAKILKVEIM